MDYRYINQLLERYWRCDTSLEEEAILRAFFSQKDIPAELEKYRPLFVYEQTEPKDDVLGDDFDERLMSIIGEPAPVRARTITMRQRLMPLFKAAAVVAIVLTLGNAMQLPFGQRTTSSVPNAAYQRMETGASVAMSDSAVIDTMQQSNLKMGPEEVPAIIK